jgi:hypothetical protein
MPNTPFAIDAALGPRLAAVLEYWRGLRRGEAEAPFADDIDMAQVRALADNVFVLGVFAKPERFRLDLARTPGAPAVEAITGRFIDEVILPAPLEFLRAQAAATVEAGAPTLHRQGGERAYARLLVPAWGEGQFKLLLGAVEWR